MSSLIFSGSGSFSSAFTIPTVYLSVESATDASPAHHTTHQSILDSTPWNSRKPLLRLYFRNSGLIFLVLINSANDSSVTSTTRTTAATHIIYQRFLEITAHNSRISISRLSSRCSGFISLVFEDSIEYLTINPTTSTSARKSGHRDIHKVTQSKTPGTDSAGSNIESSALSFNALNISAKSSHVRPVTVRTVPSITHRCTIEVAP